MILMFRPQTDATVATMSQTPFFPDLLRHSQSLSAPHSVHSFAIDAPAFPPQERRHPTITVAWMRSHQFPQPALETLLVVLRSRTIALGRPGLVERPARASFAHPELPLDEDDGLASACRASQFPRRASLRIALSSSASASNFLRRRFSSSNSRSRFASWAFMPPY